MFLTEVGLVPRPDDATEKTFNSFSTLLSNSIFVELFLSGNTATESKARRDGFALGQSSSNTNHYFEQFHCAGRSDCGAKRKRRASANHYNQDTAL